MHLMSRALLRANRLYLRQPAPILTVACNGRIERIERRRGRWRQRRRRTRREGNGRWLNDQKARRDAERARNRVGDVLQYPTFVQLYSRASPNPNTRLPRIERERLGLPDALVPFLPSPTDVRPVSATERDTRDCISTHGHS